MISTCILPSFGHWILNVEITAVGAMWSVDTATTIFKLTLKSESRPFYYQINFTLQLKHSLCYPPFDYTYCTHGLGQLGSSVPPFNYTYCRMDPPFDYTYCTHGLGQLGSSVPPFNYTYCTHGLGQSGSSVPPFNYTYCTHGLGQSGSSVCGLRGWIKAIITTPLSRL